MAKPKSVNPDFLDPEAASNREVGRLRIQVQLDSFTAEMLRKLPGDTDSDRVGTLIRRLEYFREAAVRRLGESPFSAAEWVVLVLSLRKYGGLAEYSAWQTVSYWAHMQQEAFETMYEFNPVDTATKLREAGDVVNVAVCESVDRYWMLPEKMNHADRLRTLGLIEKNEAKAWTAEQRARKRRTSAAVKVQAKANVRVMEEHSAAREEKRQRLFGGGS